MLNKSRRRQILGLALVPIALLLSVAIGWLYLIVQSGYGTSAAVLTITVVTIIILGLVGKGIQYAAAIEKAIQKQNKMQTNQAEIRNKANTIADESFGQMPYPPLPQEKFIAEAPVNYLYLSEVYEPNSQPRKHRGKQSRFPISKITQAVLRWEQRDPQFTSINLTEFLEQEFGSGPDGILLMAPTTFYDWRRRILSDINEKYKTQLNNSGQE